MHERRISPVIGTPIDVIGWNDAVLAIAAWAQGHESRMVCICNAHSVVTARSDDGLRQALDQADMSTPDGAPVAWMIRRLTGLAQDRINGPDLMLKCCERAAATGQSIYLYGATPSTLELLQQRLRERFPALRIAGAYSPPFGPLKEESQTVIDAINQSGAGIVWVGLGCPKQEKWMLLHKGKINAVMVGVGAAFDYHAGVIQRAPLWMQRSGLEWLHRLLSEPRRLWRRYLVTNSLFIWHAALQLSGRGLAKPRTDQQ